METICTLQSGPLTPSAYVPALAFLLIGYIQSSICDETIKNNYTLVDPSSGFLHFERKATYVPAYSIEPAESWCYNKSEGMYRHPHYMNNYYMCKQGENELRQCDGGLIFNEISLNCEQYSNHINPCYLQGDGFLPDYLLTDCRDYYRCEDSTLIAKRSCDPGMRFSVTDQTCRNANEIPCINVHCIGSADGYFLTPRSKCKSYYTCMNERIMYHECPEGLIFDAATRTCSTTTEGCYELICTGRTNGIYSDLTHQCERYYSCEAGVLKFIGGCPTGTLFNGSSCINRQAVTCDPVDQSALSITLSVTDVCSSLQDGPYAGTDYSCQSYILCKFGMKVAVLYCPNGQRFNGHKCVRADLVPCTSFCSDRKDGVYGDTRKRCHEYIKCINGDIISSNRCPKGTTYNEGACVAGYECPNSKTDQPIYENYCINLTDGFHTDYLTSCKYYFYCYNGQLLFNNSCPHSTVWNGSDCVNNTSYLCKGPKISPQCSDRGNGLFIDNSRSSNCNKYYYCNEGLQVQLKCPENYIFNGSKCVPFESYHCPLIDADCHNKSDSYYADTNSGCQSYYYCSDGSKITYLCPDGQVYNGSDCVSSDLFACPGNTSDDCRLLSNGYYPDIQTKCHKYFYCLNNRRIITFECPENQIYDGFKCILSETSKCHDFPKLTCKILKDSIYIRPGSDCKEYFHCSNKRMISLKRCQDKLFFNGTACTNMPKDFCKNIIETQLNDLSRCNSRNNGFYPDLSSGCKTYFYCIDGVKTVLTCPSGKLFNGEICVDDFHCPTMNIINANLGISSF